jgi:hypothetical protein
MAQVIIFKNNNGGISLTIPSGELPINEVLAKDCPAEAFIIDDSELPQGLDAQFFDAWELIDGKIVINQIKKQAIIEAQQAPIVAKKSALNKLATLGLTEDEIKAIL